ncbi:MULTISPECIES: hypothetical protein [Sphingobium]|uniref:hypothetical protein n=1 Tax=Sphingobium TaxID=165695 RepID=UPI00159C76FE|nr:hypothetical protein [Sphingobium sp. 15-1]
MSDLLEQAIAAHGGWERWRQLKTLNAHAAIGGALWHLKAWPDVFADVRVVADPHRPRAQYAPFIDIGRHSLFEPDRVAIVAADGKDIESREAPRDAFSGHGMTTPWDALHLAYFSGYAMWTYLTTPFLLNLPGFQTQEIEPWDENGETWRRLKAIFPPNIPSHGREQIFYFDASGILRRHDYSVDVIGGSSSANYALEPKTFGGIVYPTKRRVYATGPDNRPNLDRVAIAIDFRSIEPG